jgi:ADP-ribose pyrophosphatase YjhB (NUDIX family)
MTLSQTAVQKIADAVGVINECLPDSKSGLPDDIFYLISRLTPMINVDLLIVNERNEKLLTWREDQFYGPGWHIPGGIIRFKELAETRILKVAALELGVTLTWEPRPIVVREIMHPNRDVRGHFISMVYKCKLTGPLQLDYEAPNSKQPLNGQWRWFASMPPNMIRPHLQFEELINNTVF